MAMELPALSSVAVGGRALPDDLRPEPFGPEDGVEQQLQVMARRRVAVEVQRSGGLQHPVKLDQPPGHHHQVGEHVVIPEQAPHRFQRVGHLQRRATLDQLPVGRLGLLAPRPGVVESLDLCL